MSKKNEEKKMRGRPQQTNWSLLKSEVWQKATDAEIAMAAKCTKVNVFLKRRAIQAGAVAIGVSKGKPAESVKTYLFDGSRTVLRKDFVAWVAAILEGNSKAKKPEYKRMPSKTEIAKRERAKRVAAKKTAKKSA